MHAAYCPKKQNRMRQDMSSFPKAAIAAFVSVVALSACTQPANLAGLEQPANQGRNTGLAIGALAGGLLAGPITGGSAGQAAAGAAVGAAVGGLIGSDLDRQAAELQQQMGDNVTVVNRGDSLQVSFPQEILFASDSASLKSGQRQELSALASNLSAYPDSQVQVIGHTDNTGSAAHNFDLSARRAGAVSAVLVESGVSGQRLTATGKGEDNPIATNLTDEGRALNRRVEVVITPLA
jgi:outer membrane protein OmpA-like peptidoglycan-associated protein